MKRKFFLIDPWKTIFQFNLFNQSAKNSTILQQKSHNTPVISLSDGWQRGRQDPIAPLPHPSSRQPKKHTIFGDNRDNQLKGTAQKDVIDGKGGNDRLLGFAGDDTLIGGRGNDQLFGGAGKDTLYGDTGRDLLEGGAGDDRLDELRPGSDFDRNVNILRGGAGNDRLTGSGGGSSLEGGTGNDRLFTQVFNQKTDVLQGGAGNDVYEIFPARNSLSASAQLTILELPNQGIDTVIAAFDSWTLADNVENLRLQPFRGGAVATGNASDNIIRIGGPFSFADTVQGLGGNDLLNSGLGNDILVGGEGADRFLFDTSPNPAVNNPDLGLDTITDFISGTDKIALAQGTFSALTTAIGQDLGSEFASVANDVLAETSNALIVFSQESQAVFYNTNGSSPGFGTSAVSGAFAIISGISNLSSTDFEVVANGIAKL